jgi:hypothetical protein
MDTEQPVLPRLPPRQELMAPAEKAVLFANSLIVDSDDTYAYAGQELQEIKGRISALEEKRLSFTRPLDAIKKQWMEFFGEPINFLTGAEQTYKSKMLTYSTAQEKKRQEEEARLRAIAEEERRKKEAEAERLRIEAAEALKKAEEARNEGKVEEAAQLEGKAAMASLESQTAIVEATVISNPISSIAPPKVAGISTSYAYSAAIDHPMELLRAIVEGKEAIGLVDFDGILRKVNAVARISKDAFNVAGCRLIKTPTMSAGKR